METSARLASHVIRGVGGVEASVDQADNGRRADLDALRQLFPGLLTNDTRAKRCSRWPSPVRPHVTEKTGQHTRRGG
jgi:hypothetical protein